MVIFFLLKSIFRHQEQGMFVFRGFFTQKPQKRAKNGEKQPKLANFETDHGFHRKLFKASVGKAPKTAKTCPKWKTN